MQTIYKVPLDLLEIMLQDLKEQKVSFIDISFKINNSEESDELHFKPSEEKKIISLEDINDLI